MWLKVPISLVLTVVVFFLTPALGTADAQVVKGAEKVIYAFRNNGDGAQPYAGLISDAKGNLYGTSAGYYGSGTQCIHGCGTVFEMMPPAQPGDSWVFTTLYTFTGTNGDGTAPASPLVFDRSGNLYGTTSSGGTGPCYLGCGTVFELSPDAGGGWAETVLYSFQGGTDGQNPEGALIFGSNGSVYGATVVGGESNCSCGTVFQLLAPMQPGGAWTENVLYRFNSFSSGFWPEGGVVSDKTGALYGTTNEGGQSGCSDGCGVAFKLTPPRKKGGAWTEDVLYQFTGGSDGGQPYAGVIFDHAGNLYGATFIGNLYSYGAVFKLSPPRDQNGAWAETTLYTCGGTGPLYPMGGVILDGRGDLYGTTAYGGKLGLGDAFELKPPARKGGNWVETELHQFKGGKDGRWPFAGLMFGQDGVLYGTTLGGGGGKCSNGEHDFDCGTVFRIEP